MFCCLWWLQHLMFLESVNQNFCWKGELFAKTHETDMNKKKSLFFSTSRTWTWLSVIDPASLWIDSDRSSELTGCFMSTHGTWGQLNCSETLWCVWFKRQLMNVCVYEGRRVIYCLNLSIKQQSVAGRKLLFFI